MTLLSKLHYINVGPLGTFTPSGNPDYDSTPEHVDAIFDHLRDKQHKRVLLYFHGGLVDDKSGMKTAEYVTTTLLGENSSTLDPEKRVHPVSFIWETGLFSTFKDNIGQLWSTAFFKSVLEKVIKVAGESSGVELVDSTGARGFSELEYADIRAELEKTAPFEKTQDNLGSRSAAAVSGNEQDTKDLLYNRLDEEFADDPSFNNTLISELSVHQLSLIKTDQLLSELDHGSRGFLSMVKVIKTAVAITYRVIRRHIEKTDHGFYPTVMEEMLRAIYVDDLGTWTWGKMKEKAETMWLDDSGATGLNQHAGRYFLKRLKEYEAEQPDLTIDLIGHSAGSIAICYFLQEYRKLCISTPIRCVFFLAPACRSELFDELVVEHQETIQFFRMYTMSDDYESLDRCVPGIYTRSLLYMISGLLEPDQSDAYILGMQRYLKKDYPYADVPVLNRIRDFMNAPENRIVYAVTEKPGKDGLRCFSEHHGGFADEETETIKSILHELTKI